MSLITGTYPGYKTVEMIQPVTSAVRPKSVIAPIKIDLASMSSIGDVIPPGYVLGRITATGLYTTCAQSAVDGSQVPAAITHRAIVLNDSVSTIVTTGGYQKAAAMVKGWCDPTTAILDGWGADPVTAFRNAEVALRIAGFLPGYPKTFSGVQQSDMVPCYVEPGMIFSCVGDGGVMIQYQEGDLIYLPVVLARYGVKSGVLSCVAITQERYAAV